MNPLDIIRRYYEEDSKAYDILVAHDTCVAKKSLEVADRVPHLNPDKKFIYEAAMLHDIGIFLTHAPKIGCRGRYPYICHGYLGGELLAKEGLDRHALVSERHIGTGLSANDIVRQNLPLPRRDMEPISIEEVIICFSDKFYSKDVSRLYEEKSVNNIIAGLEKHDTKKADKFRKWLKLFNY
ncbi:MAG: HD domain-containing protein [Candidatus Woesearchaeota archaeon]